jgi:hypothetical protein
MDAPLTLLLFACYALALFAANRVASRLARASLLHTTALTIFLWIVNLILPVVYVGMINLLRTEAMIIAGVLLWGAEIALAGRLRPLEERDRSEDGRWRIMSWIGFVACAGAYAFVYLSEVPRLPQFLPVLEVDVAWHYLPSVINMVQAGTLNAYDMFLPYFPLAFESLFAWELALLQSYRLISLFQYALLIGGLLYLSLLVRWLLRTRPALVADLAIFIMLLVLLRSDYVLSLVYNPGKGDILVFAMTIAALYYLVRFWEGSGERQWVVLAGIACGVLISAKLSTAIWIIPLNAAHLFYRLSRREINGRVLAQDAALAILPALVVALPWGVRILFQPPTRISYEQLNALGMANTVVNQWHLPQFVNPTLERANELLLVGGGLLIVLVTASRNRNRAILLVQIVGALLILAGLWQQAAETWQRGVTMPHHFSPFLLMLIGSGVVALVGWRAPKLIPFGHTAVHALVAVSMIAFSFMPYSAWAYPVPYLFEATWYNINYRYTPASLPLFVAAIIATCAYLLTRTLRREVTQGVAPMGRWRHLVGVGLTALLLVGISWQMTAYRPNRLLDRYANFNWRLPEATGFFHWFDEQIRDARIYSINAPPLMLYGRDLSNQVYYTTGGHSGYYGDQAYRWDEIQRLIEEKQLDYIVISFNYPEVMQSALAPTPEVLAEIDQMRATLRTVFEDAQVTMFATEYAEDVP